MTQLEQAYRTLCTNDYFTFVKEAWLIIEPNREFVIPPYVPYLCSRLQQFVKRVADRDQTNKSLIICVPPSTGKSTYSTKMLQPFAHTFASWLRFITTSYSEKLAMDHTIKSRDIVTSDWYREHWGQKVVGKKDTNRSTEFANMQGGLRYGAGVNGTIRGRHADIFGIDDSANPDIKEFPTDADFLKVNMWFDGTASNRLTDLRYSRFINNMQRLDYNDLAGHQMATDPDDYDRIILPAELSENVYPEECKLLYVNGLLDPIRLGEGELKKQQRKMGSRHYGAQYMQAPLNIRGALIKKDWFGRWNMQTLYGRKVVWDAACDLAYTSDQANDASGVMLYTVVDGKMYIKKVATVHKEFWDLMHWLPNYLAAHGFSTKSICRVEPKASGKDLVSVVRKATNLNVIESVAPTRDKEARIKGELPYIEAGNVYLLEGEAWLESFLYRVCGFPTKGIPDEEVDMLQIACNNVDTIYTGKLEYEII